MIREAWARAHRRRRWRRARRRGWEPGTARAWRITLAYLGPGDRARLSELPAAPRARPVPGALRWDGERRTVRLQVETAAGELAWLECWRFVVAPWEGDRDDGILFRGCQTPGQAFCGALRVTGRGVRVYLRSSPVAMLAAATSADNPPPWRAVLPMGTFRRLASELEHRARVLAVLPPRPPDAYGLTGLRGQAPPD